MNLPLVTGLDSPTAESPDFASSRFTVYAAAFVSVALICVLAVIFWSLDKGLVFSDESWYLLHLSTDVSSLAPSSWHILAKLIYPHDAFTVRLMTVLLLLASNVVFGAGVYHYFQLKSRLLLYVLICASCIGQFILVVPIQLVPSYLTLNIFLIVLGTGLSLLSYHQRLSISAALIYLSGLVLGFLPFVFITNSPFLLLLSWFLVACAPMQRGRVLLFFLCGVLSALLLYFAFLQSPSEYFGSLAAAGELLQYDATHGPWLMVVWMLKTVLYFASQVLGPAAVWFLVARGYPTQRSLRWILASLLAIYLLLTVRQDTIYQARSIMPMTLLFIVYCAAFLILRGRKGAENPGIFFLIAAIPVCASLGSDIPVEYRGAAYVAPVFAGAILLVHRSANRILQWSFLLLLFLMTLNFVRFTFVRNWSGEILAHQNFPVARLGINQRILLDPPRARLLKAFLANVPSGSTVVVSDISLWGFVYLNSCNPLYLDFRYREEHLFKYLSRVPADVNRLIYIDCSTQRFSPDFFERLARFGFRKSAFQRINVMRELTIYRPLRSAPLSGQNREGN